MGVKNHRLELDGSMENAVISNSASPSSKNLLSLSKVMDQNRKDLSHHKGLEGVFSYSIHHIEREAQFHGITFNEVLLQKPSGFIAFFGST